MANRLCVLVFLLGASAAIQAQRDAMSAVMDNVYNNARRDSPPKAADGGPVKVKLQLDLIDIVEADKSHNQVDIIAWQFMTWSNPNVKWSDDYNITLVHMEKEMMWVPDITVYNLASPVQQMSPELVAVSSEGVYVYVPFQRYRFLCDVTGYDSRSGVTCTIKMGSWVYNGNLLSLEDPTPQSFSLGNYFADSKYEILSTDVQRNVQTYPCCPEPYEDITFTFTFKKKGGFLSSLWG